VRRDRCWVEAPACRPLPLPLHLHLLPPLLLPFWAYQVRQPPRGLLASRWSQARLPPHPRLPRHRARSLVRVPLGH